MLTTEESPLANVASGGLSDNQLSGEPSPVQLMAPGIPVAVPHCCNCIYTIPSALRSTGQLYKYRYEELKFLECPPVSGLVVSFV